MDPSDEHVSFAMQIIARLFSDSENCITLIDTVTKPRANIFVLLDIQVSSETLENEKIMLRSKQVCSIKSSMLSE